MSDKITAVNIKDAILNKYSDPQRYSVLFEVNEGTGAIGRTWIDALVVSLWPSDGLLRRGFEVKISRSDFKSELNNAGKNQFFKNNCHEFWYATAKGVVKSIDEIPEGCGWMVMRGSVLTIKKQALRKDAKNASDAFLASIVRNVCNVGGVQKDVLRREIKQENGFKENEKCATVLKNYFKANGGGYWNNV